MGEDKARGRIHMADCRHKRHEPEGMMPMERRLRVRRSMYCSVTRHLHPQMSTRRHAHAHTHTHTHIHIHIHTHKHRGSMARAVAEQVLQSATPSAGSSPHVTILLPSPATSPFNHANHVPSFTPSLTISCPSLRGHYHPLLQPARPPLTTAPKALLHPACR